MCHLFWHKLYRFWKQTKTVIIIEHVQCLSQYLEPPSRVHEAASTPAKYDELAHPPLLRRSLLLS